MNFLTFRQLLSATALATTAGIFASMTDVKAATISIQPLTPVPSGPVIPLGNQVKPIKSTDPFILPPNTPTDLTRDPSFHWTDLIISDIQQDFTVQWNLPGFNGTVTVNGSSSNADSGSLSGTAGQTVTLVGNFPNPTTATNFLSAGVTVTPSGKPIPEPSSILSLLALGTLGAASTLKRQLKSSKSSEKETTKVS